MFIVLLAPPPLLALGSVGVMISVREEGRRMSRHWESSLISLMNVTETHLSVTCGFCGELLRGNRNDCDNHSRYRISLFNPLLSHSNNRVPSISIAGQLRWAV